MRRIVSLLTSRSSRPSVQTSVCIASLTVCLAFTAPVQAEHRAALLIANSDYGQHTLASPAADAKAVAEVLKEIGFCTTIVENLGGDAMKQQLQAFAQSVPTRGTALVYFAGYALQGNKDERKDNFLIPVGTEIRSARDVGGRGYGVGAVLALLQQQSGSSANVVIVDGCYAWPNKLEDVPAGLMAMKDVGKESLVCFSAQPGKVIAPKEKLSPLAKNFADVVGSLRAPTAGLGESGLHSFVVNSTLRDNQCLNPQAATAACAPPDGLRDGQHAGDEWVNGQGMVFCWCPAGKFTMGSSADEQGHRDDENPVDVTLNHGFWMAKYETTKRECSRQPTRAIASHKNHPIDYVHYDDFKQYLRMLNETERKAGRLPAGWEYALPTEAQWEYACRAGTTTQYSYGEAASGLPLHGNFADRSLHDAKDDYYRYAHRVWDDGATYLSIVGSYAANPWGLCDMHGNLWELCGTRYSPQNIGGVDPQGDPKNGGWAVRGGSWASWPEYCRSAFRQHYSSRDEQNFLGFRIVLQRTK